MMKITFLFIIYIQLTLLSFGQQRCHTEDYHRNLGKEQPLRNQKLTDYNEAYSAYKLDLDLFKKNQTSAIVYIPVVFHVLYKTSTQNIPDSKIFEQIERLNKDYSATNIDTSTVPLEFKPFISDTKIRFILAFKDPNGNSTSGIKRYQTDTFTFSFSSDNIKKPAFGGVASWDTDNYLNIWVGNITPGILGYATKPIDAGTSKDGVVISYKNIGNNTSNVYNKGRTATHEIGHYLGLDHLWGYGGCSSDDGITDTPNQKKEHYGVPTHPISTCNSNDMFMNYMDYGNDEVLVMFTTNQKAKMEYSLDNIRSELSLPESVGLDTTNKQTFMVYPNPTTHILNVQCSNTSNEGTLYLMDVSGKHCIRKKVSNTGTTQLHISELNTGLYFLGYIEQGSHKIIQKVIIQ